MKAKRRMKYRHRIVRNLAYLLLAPVARLKYGITVEPFRAQGRESYLILYNHQTAFDQFFVGMAFRGPIYYVASEDLFSNGLVSQLIRWLVDPIPIKKQTTDMTAVRNCLRLAKEGGTIAIAPEGNRTYSGKTEYMNPAIAPLARKLGLPIALYRIEGGYGVQPRWSDGTRKGKMRSYVSEVIRPEEYKTMDNDALMERIRQGLYVNEGVADATFRSGKTAEYLERAIYVCPTCGPAVLESKGEEIRCTKCGCRTRYGQDKRLTGINCDFPFSFVTEWYDYQSEYICGLDVTKLNDTPLFTDTAALRQVELYKCKHLLNKAARIALYGDRMELAGQCLPFDKISALSVLGRNKLNIYYEDKLYQLKGDKRFNALKYVQIYYRYKNIRKGDENGKFLGL